MADWKDILSDDDEHPNEEELINYVGDHLSEEEKYALEKKIIDSSFTSDAVEGLQTFDKKSNLYDYVQQLNKNLNHQLSSKKERKEKRRLKDNPWVTITIIVLLAICILGYYLIHLHTKNKQIKEPPKTESQAKKNV